MLIDIHSHFLHERTPRADWAERNASRLAASRRIGTTWEVASILGSWGRTSPTYFPSPADLTWANERQRQLCRDNPGRVRGYITVNPNFTGHALDEIERGVAGGMVGIKLAASRRASDALLDPVVDRAAAHGFPVLHHIWQGRRGEPAGQEASDGLELGELARRHPRVPFILAHIAGGGPWWHTLRAVRGIQNVIIDLSGSGVDAGMVESVLVAVGPERMVWGTDLTMGTGLSRLHVLERLLTAEDFALVAWKNAVRIFPAGAFDPHED